MENKGTRFSWKNTSPGILDLSIITNILMTMKIIVRARHPMHLTELESFWRNNWQKNPQKTNCIYFYFSLTFASYEVNEILLSTVQTFAIFKLYIFPFLYLNCTRFKLSAKIPYNVKEISQEICHLLLAYLSDSNRIDRCCLSFCLPLHL